MEAAKSISAEVVGWGIAICAGVVALSFALGGVEGQIGQLFSIPGLSVSARTRVVVVILALAIAAAAVPISNAVAEALW